MCVSREAEGVVKEYCIWNECSRAPLNSHTQNLYLKISLCDSLPFLNTGINAKSHMPQRIIFVAKNAKHIHTCDIHWVIWMYMHKHKSVLKATTVFYPWNKYAGYHCCSPCTKTCKWQTSTLKVYKFTLPLMPKQKKKKNTDCIVMGYLRYLGNVNKNDLNKS